MDRCAICSGELVVIRAVLGPNGGWLCRCQGSCHVLQILSDEEIENGADRLEDYRQRAADAVYDIRLEREGL